MTQLLGRQNTFSRGIGNAQDWWIDWLQIYHAFNRAPHVSLQCPRIMILFSQELVPLSSSISSSPLVANLDLIRFASSELLLLSRHYLCLAVP